MDKLTNKEPNRLFSNSHKFHRITVAPLKWHTTLGYTRLKLDPSSNRVYEYLLNFQSLAFLRQSSQRKHEKKKPGLEGGKSFGRPNPIKICNDVKQTIVYMTKGFSSHFNSFSVFFPVFVPGSSQFRLNFTNLPLGTTTEQAYTRWKINVILWIYENTNTEFVFLHKFHTYTTIHLT